MMHSVAGATDPHRLGRNELEVRAVPPPPAAPPRLIHLNGPPGIGKSTIARLYADRHPGVLSLDIDQVRRLIGGWRERFSETGALARTLAVGMADAHLRSGHDVVLPQYLGRLSEIERFETIAHDSGAVFREIVLHDNKEQSIRRFTQRGGAMESGWHREVQEQVDRAGGVSALSAMHDHLTEALRRRPAAIVIASHEGRLAETYEAVTAALADPHLELSV